MDSEGCDVLYATKSTLDEGFEDDNDERNRIEKRFFYKGMSAAAVRNNLE